MNKVTFIVKNPALQNPRPATAQPARPVRLTPTKPPFQGANLWAVWHRRALDWQGDDDSAWIRTEILAKLPCGECSNHAKAYLADHPPYFTAADYFTWTVAFHNAVNTRLGREPWTVEKAHAHWGASG